MNSEDGEKIFVGIKACHFVLSMIEWLEIETVTRSQEFWRVVNSYPLTLGSRTPDRICNCLDSIMGYMYNLTVMFALGAND